MARLGKTTKGLATRQARVFAIVGIGACFVAWASLFIYKSSFVGIDGRRYFCLFDDGMISMRYAWNLSHGLGLVWNPSEYVEGYTNPLMTLIMALPTLVFDKVGAVLAVQILGIIFMLVNAYLVMSIADHLTTLGQEEHYRGIARTFGNKFRNQFLEGRDLHSTAWCWSPYYGPRMLKRDWSGRTTWGNFARDYLRAYNESPVRP